MIPFTSIEVEVLGKRLNHGYGGGYGLKIPLRYLSYGQGKIVQWLTKKLETVIKSYLKFRWYLILRFSQFLAIFEKFCTSEKFQNRKITKFKIREI